ncbi:MAG: LysR substrate-binding domain-containing protein [Limibacillus sp.]|jgi:DNA-binding transcriptional LysR family regulator
MESLRRLIPSANALLAFEAAARLGSFTRAGQEMGVSQAAVSYAIRQLEEALGVALFLRRHRRVELTESGERFFNDVALGLSHIRRSAEEIRRDRDESHVTLSLSTAFASYWIVPRLSDFRRRHPEIDLRLQTTDKDVDLAAEGISLGIRRGRSGMWPGCGEALFTQERVQAVCAPGYLSEAGPFDDLAALTRAKLIHLEEPFRPRPSWPEWFASHGQTFEDRGEGLRLNDYALVIQAAFEGQGVALGWRHLVDDLMRRGFLTAARPEILSGEAAFYLVWPEGALARPQVRAVKDWLLEKASDQPAP